MGVVGCCGEVGIGVGGVEGEGEGEITFTKEEDIGSGVNGERVQYWVGGLWAVYFHHSLIELGSCYCRGRQSLEINCL